MSSRYFIYGVLVAISLTGCVTTPSVFTDYDSSQSFDSYQSFSWISDEPMIVSGDRGPNPITAKRLRDAIVSTLERKGYQFVESPDEVDFVVSFTVGARDRIEIREREVIDYFGPHWRWGYDYFGVITPRNFPRTEVTSRQYAEGSLAIDIFDVDRKSPVWHGSASKRLSRSELEGRAEDTTQVAVETILADFPSR